MEHNVGQNSTGNNNAKTHKITLMSMNLLPQCMLGGFPTYLPHDQYSANQMNTDDGFNSLLTLPLFQDNFS